MRILFFLAAIFISSLARSQVIAERDPVIEKMVKEISPDSLSFYIKYLVGFGTRNTLSTQSDSKRGIGAARLWVLKKFNELKETKFAQYNQY